MMWVRFPLPALKHVKKTLFVTASRVFWKICQGSESVERLNFDNLQAWKCQILRISKTLIIENFGSKTPSF